MKCHDDYIWGERLRIFDNRGKTNDRYTIVFMRRDVRYVAGCLFRQAVGADQHGSFYQHTECMVGKHLGLRIKLDDCPQWLQQAIQAELCPAGDRSGGVRGVGGVVGVGNPPRPTKGSGGDV